MISHTFAMTTLSEKKQQSCKKFEMTPHFVFATAFPLIHNCISILPPGAGDRELGCINCFPCSSSSRLSLLLLLFFSFPPSSFHIFFRFFVNFCVLSLFNCKMRSLIAYGANNVALPSTISRKQDHEIAKSHIFLRSDSYCFLDGFSGVMDIFVRKL